MLSLFEKINKVVLKNRIIDRNFEIRTPKK
jgi:hypothetical protein